MERITFFIYGYTILFFYEIRKTVDFAVITLSIKVFEKIEGKTIDQPWEN